jgi:F420-dependent oxidoreductase-like protein
MILGLGTSGPQVVEGWHGVPFDKPLTWMREYVTIVRKVFEREGALEFSGARYQIPYRGPGATGLGKPLKSILHGRKDIPILSGSMAPKGQALAAEIADGILFTCLHPGRFDVIEANLKEGFAKRDPRRRPVSEFEIAPTVAVIVGNDLDACRAPLKQSIAFYVGGMGAREKNFYGEYIRRVGFEAEAEKIQTLFLSGKRDEAVAAVTDEMVDTLHLVGTPERIRDRFQAWRASKVTTLIIGTQQREALRLLAELALS